MTTNRQLESNRANALKSTGPRTPEGKDVVALNSVTHGLTAAAVVHPAENPAEFHIFREAMLADLAPESTAEIFLAERIIADAWRLRRVAGIEVHFYDPVPDASAADSTAPNLHAPGSPEAQMALAWLRESETGNFNNLNRHEAHLHRILTRDLNAYMVRRHRRELAAQESAMAQARVQVAQAQAEAATQAAARAALPPAERSFQENLDSLLTMLERQTALALKESQHRHAESQNLQSESAHA